MKLIAFCLLSAVCWSVTQAQTSPRVEVLTTGTKTSLRGLSVVNDSVVWVSGSGGKVGLSTNSGKSWKWITVKGFEKTDFRDIEAFSASAAVIMGISEPAYILKTIDGGETWKTIYKNNTKGMFLDAMDFRNEKEGIVVGDPMDGIFFIANTTDSGDSWSDAAFQNRPAADSGEACFASSGTNIRAFKKGFYLVSGGLRSSLITKSHKTPLPLVQGQETTGANSIAVWRKRLIVVGGDFNKPASSEKACFYSHNGGKTWKVPVTLPNGYRSCVEYISKKTVVTCGLTGVDLSKDGGASWQPVSAEGFHVCRKAKNGSAVYLAGGNGKIGKLVF